MKTLHLFAVGIAAAMALGAAGGYGLGQFVGQEIETPATEQVRRPMTDEQSAAQKALQSMAGPWKSDLHIVMGPTLDSLGEATTFVERAGVPTVVQRQDGSLLAAYQWFPEDHTLGFDRVAVSSSTDGGVTWSEPALVVIEGLPEGYQRPFDPTLAVLEDGSVRLYFTSSTTEKPASGQMTEIYAATSEDGVNYVFDGAAFAVDGERAYDSAAVFFDGLWHIATPHAPDQGAYHGVSSDGLIFTAADALSNGSQTNWTGNFYSLENLAYFFGTASQASDHSLWFSDSNDMKTWSDPTVLDISGGDPAAVYVQDQGWVLIYVSEPVRTEE